MTDSEILDRVLSWETSTYTDDPRDRGRCTRWGITLKTLQDWRGSATCEDVKHLTEEEARAIYQARYVKPFDGLDDDVKPQLVDIAVLSGVLTARTMLALAQQDARPLNTALVIQRLKHFVRLCQARPEQVCFLGGWVNRAVSYL